MPVFSIPFRFIFAVTVLLLSQVVFLRAAGADILSPEERAWLDKHDGIIRLAPSPDYPPMSFRGSDGSYGGLASDYVEIIQRRLGFRFEIIWKDNWSEILESVKNREIDVIDVIHVAEEREGYLNFTTPYLNIPNAIFVRSGTFEPSNLGDLSGRKLAIGKGYATVEFVKAANPDIQIVEVINSTAGLQALSVGEVD
ncbi:MAG: transporter substrate-binding domain-containing protein, partial [Rhodospirillales bacterium]|nr:transporter substrate-binding domain-containing protein [Rhodospirillales bacterium]